MHGTRVLICPAMTRWLRHGGLGALGLGFLAAALASHRSEAERAVFGRWSWGIAIVLGALAVAAVGLVVRSVHQGRRATGDRASSFPWAGCGLLLWGGAQFLSSRFDASAVTRLLDGGLCASVHPLPSLLEWVAIVLLLIAATCRWGPRLWSRVRGSTGARAALANLGLTAVAVVAVLVLGEGLARLRVAIHPTVQGFPSLSTLAWRMRYAPLNAAGQRDRDHPLTAPEGRARLLVVGDSVAWGWGVEKTEDRFGEQLARLLTAAGPRTWESITRARSDTHTLDHIDLLGQALAFHPDVAVLLYVFNDIDYLSRVTPRRRLGTLHPLRLLIANSCLAQEVAVRVWLLSRATPGAVDPYLDVTLVRQHLEDVRRFVEVARAGGARPLVVPLDVRVVQQGEPRARYDLFVREAVAAGLPIVPIDDALAGSSFDELTINRIDRHPNARAHGLAAAVVADRLRDGTR